MLFRKLKITSPGRNGQPEISENWHMVIRSYEDLMKYLNVDASYFAQAMFSLQKNMTESHLSAPRERILSIAMQSAVMSAPEGSKVWPHEVVSDFVHKKAQAMLRFLNTNGALRVNESGGYCGYDDFVRTWNAEVIAETEVDGTYFPTDSEPLKGDLLMLENAERVNITLQRAITTTSSFDESEDMYNINNKKIARITLMKEHDPKWVAASIMNFGAIAFSSEFQDENQLDSMMELFSKIPSKKIYIMTSNKSALTNHKLYTINSELHQIKFL